MKKLIFVLVIAACLVVLYLAYQSKAPTAEDVYQATNNWSPEIEQVHFVERIDGKWITVFQSNNMLFAAVLRDNWPGGWELQYGPDHAGPVGSTGFEAQAMQDVIWGASRFNGTSFYFGRIVNPDIVKIRIEVEGKTLQPPIYTSSGSKLQRFYYQEFRGSTVSFYLTGLSEDGTILYTEGRKP